jgi:hypothetical protein
VDPSPPIATPTLAPRRIDPDRRPTRANGDPTNDRPRGGTVARGEPAAPAEPAARSGNRDRAPAAPAATPPRDGGGTMRPARAERARSEAPPQAAQSRREFGARREP